MQTVPVIFYRNIYTLKLSKKMEQWYDDQKKYQSWFTTKYNYVITATEQKNLIFIG